MQFTAKKLKKNTQNKQINKQTDKPVLVSLSNKLIEKYTHTFFLFRKQNKL